MICEGCGKEFVPKTRRYSRFCTVTCHHKTRPPAKPKIGHRYLMRNGYIRVSTEKGRGYEHRLVMEQVLGRQLLRTEDVHHVNGDTTDNRPENLRVHSSHAEHFRVEHPDMSVAMVAGQKPGLPRSTQVKAKIAAGWTPERRERAAALMRTQWATGAIRPHSR